MRYEAEGGDPANAGLQHARVFLEPVKEEHPWITYADLWTLAGGLSGSDMIPFNAVETGSDVLYLAPDHQARSPSKRWVDPRFHGSPVVRTLWMTANVLREGACQMPHKLTTTSEKSSIEWDSMTKR